MLKFHIILEEVMQKYLPIILAALVAGCGQQQPSQTVYKVYDAVQRKDTAAFKSLMCKARQDYYQQNPSAIPNLLNVWQHSQIKGKPEVLDERTDGHVAIVTYKVQESRGDTTYHVQLYLEDGSWKFGSL